jgi:uncharacterized protein
MKTEKTTITRLPKRGAYNTDTINGIVDEALFCTLSYTNAKQPFSIPTGHCRIGNHLYIHGSVGAGYMRQMAENIPVCISITLLDDLVLAKSAFHHSVNYRSVVAFATAELVEDFDEKMKALEVFTEKMIPNRWKDCRWPNEAEMRKTMVLKFSLEEASAKIRADQANDDDEDYNLPHWAGLVHYTTIATAYTANAITEEQNIPYPNYFGL